MRTLSILSVLIFALISCNDSSNPSKKEHKVKAIDTQIVSKTLANDTTFSFNNYKIGELPSGWSQYYTGKKGENQNWQIVADNSNNVLAQLTSKNPNYHFNEIIFDGFTAKNVELKVRIKGVEGKMDQGGGFVWRFIDSDNYYVVRANPLEDNVVLYKVENGKRTDLPLIGKGKTYGADVEKLGDGWNNLRLTVINQIFTIYLNDKEIFKVDDDTFKNAGKVGLWTKADAVTYFDDFTIKKLN